MLPDGWVKTTVGKSCTIRNTLRFPLNATDRANMPGEYPYFGPTGKLDAIDHYRIDEPFALIGEDGDHFLKFRDRPMTLYFDGKANVNNHAHIIGDSKECLAKWFYYCFMHRDLTATLSRQGVGRYKLTKSGLEQLELALPPKQEQAAIVEVLSTWDQAIATTEQLLANSRHQKILLSQQVLTGKARLAGFTASGHKRNTPYGSVPVEWDYPRIGDVAAEISEKLGDSAPHPVLSCTKHHGLVDSLKYFKKQVFSVNTSTYKVAPWGCFVYATNHIDEGSIGYQNLYEAGLISPMYTVFKTSDKVVDAYLFALLKTEHYRQIFASAINASVDRRGSLRWKDFQRIHIPLPPVEEQQAIATMLAQAGREVALIKNQLDLLREEKSALMSQLLTGKRRVRLPTDEAAHA
ncbi:restriction endonuclease subunit S [Xanthomonas campestris pv. campestris]|uniref:restriction endonuclease subunit S n=1 Tax=Xanthomonas campestris TaxID=339 RepID=UPI002378C9D9|nr:restriction endonuclease subunit S [Xanthomonas campestris]MDO0861666.1 restriction endonuclease subunit S [Xanthomonas campestris pv. campestris]MEA0925103.1 restriction endonuclease subunit S [Xanthomonas campestris pv. campestris]MEB1203431.1 restriction endonuclease subunit S [Xanthomonas campestris pv. campestris]MEB1240932.1 restriction endonuclease subunit S [Xanthomonas campestris pv. campestris]MEB1482870.1 restriction endonuclease subunit S [Xanthomonas campestris pv. campestris]